jgi:chromosome segregation ATPase
VTEISNLDRSVPLGKPYTSPVALNEVDFYETSSKFRSNLELDSVTRHVATHDEQLRDLRASARRSESRIAALREQLSRSQDDLESTSARYTELAGEIPADVAGLGDQLSRILSAATAEADEIRAEARRFAEAVGVEAEDRAARTLAEAQLEHEAATALRADLETQSKQVRSDIGRLREQAASNAEDIVREAKDTAEEMLARVQRDIDTRLTVAQVKLDELVGVRAKITTQLRNFYDKFNQMEESVAPIAGVRVLRLASDSSASRYGAHAAVEIEPAQGAIDGAG